MHSGIMTAPVGKPLMNSDNSPLLMSRSFMDSTCQDSQDTIDEVDTAHNSLRSHDEATAPDQLPEFYTFVYALTESYNDNPVRIVGLEKALNPLIFLDPTSQHYKVRKDLLTKYNVRVINALMLEHSNKKGSVFSMGNAILKTIFNRPRPAHEARRVCHP